MFQVIKPIFVNYFVNNAENGKKQNRRLQGDKSPIVPYHHRLLQLESF